jgi:hypothetical protein
MLFAMRINLPDSPGSLGAVASALSEGGANILTLEVIDRDGGLAVDHLVVEAPEGLTDALVRVSLDVPAATVEAVRPVDAFPNVAAPMELAAQVSESGTGALDVAAEGIPGALWTTWCVAVRLEPSGLEAIAASPCSPVIAGLAAPWWYPAKGMRLRSDDWMPAAWRMGKLSYEVAAAPIVGLGAALLAARRHGPRFRASELHNLELLARMAANAWRRGANRYSVAMASSTLSLAARRAGGIAASTPASPASTR